MKPRSRDSLERGLIHHHVDYSPPEQGRRAWRIRTTLVLTETTSEGYVEMTGPQVQTFLLGLLEAERRAQQETAVSGR